MLKKILVTGFYGSRVIPEPDIMNNPSGIVASRLDGRSIGEYEIRGVVINSPIHSRAAQIRSLLQQEQPVAYLALGVATDAEHFQFQKEVHNEITTAHLVGPLDGDMRNIPVVTGAPQRYVNDRIDFDALMQRFSKEGLQTSIFERLAGAGGLATAYAQLHYSPSSLPVLFMHVPADPGFNEWITSMTGNTAAGMLPLATMERAALLAIKEILPSR
jgi:pyrrolidone-carboxylate peptidase